MNTDREIPLGDPFDVGSSQGGAANSLGEPQASNGQALSKEAPTRSEKRRILKQRKRRSTGRTLAEWVVVLVGALIVAQLLKAFVFQAFWIPSESMVPTLVVKDRVLVNKLAHDSSDLHHGDIVVFRPPATAVVSTADLIKRVIGLPGDTIEAIDGRVYVNGELQAETYLPDGTQTLNLPLQTVPANSIFVMGDNRGDSHDSRYSDIGPIPIENVVGRAFIRIWPPSRWGRL